MVRRWRQKHSRQEELCVISVLVVLHAMPSYDVVHCTAVDADGKQQRSQYGSLNGCADTDDWRRRVAQYVVDTGCTKDNETIPNTVLRSEFQTACTEWWKPRFWSQFCCSLSHRRNGRRSVIPRSSWGRLVSQYAEPWMWLSPSYRWLLLNRQPMQPAKQQLGVDRLVVWSEQRSAVFCTRCSIWMVLVEGPCNRALQ